MATSRIRSIRVSKPDRELFTNKNLVELTQSGLNILLIDDDKAFVDVIAKQLRESGHHETKVVYGAEEAVKELDAMTAGVDLILVDYQMPGMNGLEFLRWMQQAKRETPVIMVTASTSEMVAVEAMKLGAYDYLRKDFLDINTLKRAIEATHERHQFRIEQEFEKERLREMALNLHATDKARDVLNTITPPLNTAIANINFEIEVKSEELLANLEPRSRDKIRILLETVMKEVRVLEMSVRGILTLYRILYARYQEEDEIDEIRRDVEANLKSSRKP